MQGHNTAAKVIEICPDGIFFAGYSADTHTRGGGRACRAVENDCFNPIFKQVGQLASVAAENLYSVIFKGVV